MIQKNRQLLLLIERLAEKEPAGPINLRAYTTGDRIIRQDQQLSLVHIIRSGVVKCTITEENGKDYILEFLGEGEILGELEAIRAKPALSHVDALTPLQVYSMTATHFRHLLQSMPDLNATLMELLATRVANAAVKGARQQLYTLSELLPQLLETLSLQKITFSKKELAEYLGISLRSLNRELQKISTPNY